MASRSLLDQLLGDGDVAGFPSSDLDAARAAVRDPARADPERIGALPLPLAEAVLQASVRQKLTSLAEALAMAGNKPLAKAAKKALYQLRSSGVEVQTPKHAAEEKAPLAPEREEDFPCFLSPVSGTGERAILLHHLLGTRIETLYVVMSDEHGAVESVVGETSRGKFAKMVKMLRGEQRADVEIPLEQARRIVGEAAALNLATRSPFPQGFSEAMRHFDISPAERPFEVPPVEEGDLRLTLEGATLHDQPEIATWMPSEGDLKVLAQKFAAVESSLIELTPGQRADQFRQTIRDQARASFTPQVRAVYARRLWAMAEVFDYSKREHPAQIARAEARRLAHDPNEPFSRFAEMLFEKVFRLMATPPGTPIAGEPVPEADRPGEKRSPGGLILST